LPPVSFHDGFEAGGPLQSKRERYAQMSGSTLGGPILIGIAFIMFLLALPREGRVVGFLRRDSMQALYMMTIILLFALGLVISLSNFG
jgi:hypothetical protein